LYLTFSEYQGWGGKLNEQDFNRLEFVARMKIDCQTQNRLQEEEPVRETVKRLVFELVERGHCGSLDGVETTSLSEGGVSASFESNAGKAEDLIKCFLSGEGLITQGGISFARANRV
jgi:hypothetical protein